MPVQTIECHIATVLMKRFLDGDDLPEELLSDLEKHVQACPSCQATLNNEKATIEEVLDGPKKKGVLGAVAGLVGKKSESKAPEKPVYAQTALVEASRKSLQSVPQGSAAFKNPKVLMLSGGLAIVLVLMSTVLRDPTALLGKKAAAGLATTVETDKPSDKPEDKTANPNGETNKDPEGDVKTGTEGDGSGTMAHSSTDPEADTNPPVEGDAHTAEGDTADSHGTGEVAQGDVTGHPNGAHPGVDGKMATVPGKKTIDEGSVILIGGHDEPAKPATTTKKPATTTKKPATKRTSTRAKSSPKKSSGGGGIKVYDPSGRPIK